MEYRLYTTPAFVLARTPSGEANSRVWFLTRDLGLIQANAQAARSLASKHRYGLQTLSLSVVSVVRGKSGWRVTSVMPQYSYYSRLNSSTAAVDVAAKVALALRTLCAGEEHQPELFTIFTEVVNSLSEDSLNYKECRAIECIALLRILSRLGYVGDDKLLIPFTSSSGFDQPLIQKVTEHKRNIIRTINKAFEASHLVSARYA
ncbi:MAG: recombination protein O N-terminal domain-containing protein [Candidatus Paceibacterota bacterium]